MWELPFKSLILLFIPETVTLTLLAFAFARFEFRLAPVMSIAVIESIIGFFVRKLPIYFGIHTFILFCTLALMLYVYRRRNIARIITASFLAMSILNLLDFATVYLLEWTWPAYFELAKENALIWALSAYPYMACIVLLALIINRRNKKRKNMDLSG